MQGFCSTADSALRSVAAAATSVLRGDGLGREVVVSIGQPRSGMLDGESLRSGVAMNEWFVSGVAMNGRAVKMS